MGATTHTYCMRGFREWLLLEARAQLIEPAVLQGYEQAFRQQLEALVRKTNDPVLRQKFREMLDCPIVDLQGRCHNFTEFILNSLVRHGIHKQYDIEAALQHVFEKMMLDKSLVTGEPRRTVFRDFDPTRPYQPGDNPLQARFLTYLMTTIRNIKAGSVPRVGKVERPQGTISIGAGRSDEKGLVSPDEIAAPETNFQELLDDIRALLSRRESETSLPLLAVLDAPGRACRRDRGARAVDRGDAADTARQLASRAGGQPDRLRGLRARRRGARWGRSPCAPTPRPPRPTACDRVPGPQLVPKATVEGVSSKQPPCTSQLVLQGDGRGCEQ